MLLSNEREIERQLSSTAEYLQDSFPELIDGREITQIFAYVHASSTSLLFQKDLLRPTIPSSSETLKLLTKENVAYPPINPNASFLGLPAELRLQIYSCLAESLHFHVTPQLNPVNEGRWYGREKKWVRQRQLCTALHTGHTQLCTESPLFRPSHKSKLRHKNPRKGYSFAIRSTCRLVHEETRGIFELNDDLVSQIPNIFTMEALRTDWLWTLLTPQGRKSLVTLTIGSGSRFPDFQTAVPALCKDSNSFPNLRSIAIQMVEPYHKFTIKQSAGPRLFAPAETWKNLWYVKALNETFGGKVTISSETWVLLQAGHRYNLSREDQMVVIRGVIWGQGERTWAGREEFEMVRNRVVLEELEREGKQLEEGKQWWQWFYQGPFDGIRGVETRNM